MSDHDIWVNIYGDGTRQWKGNFDFSTREEASSMGPKDPQYLGTVRLSEFKANPKLDPRNQVKRRL